MSMILGFRHKDLERLFQKDERQGIPHACVNKITRILARLDEATQPGDMNLPGYQLHQLKGKLAGRWAVRVSRNWRATFRFVSENVTDVNLVDYHWEEKMPMRNPPHPGLCVLHDCLEPLGLSVAEGARRLGVSQKELSGIVNCRSAISKDMALRLDRAFGGGAGIWRRSQETYDSVQAAAQRRPG